MLVFTRKFQDKIVINGEIIITIVKIEGGQVRIGIDAPKSMEVHRAEIFKDAHPDEARKLGLIKD